MHRRLLLLAVVLYVAGCERAPRDLREWRPADHDQEPAAAGPEMPAPSASEDEAPMPADPDEAP